MDRKPLNKSDSGKTVPNILDAKRPRLYNTNAKTALLLPIAVALMLPLLGAEGGVALLMMILLSTFVYIRYPGLRLILLLALGARFAVAVIDSHFDFLPYGWDNFYTSALQIKHNLQGGYPVFYRVPFALPMKSYALFSSLVLWTLGDSELYLRLLNGFFGVLAAVRVYDTAREVDLGPRSARLALMLSAFWPSFVLFQSLNMREALILFLSLDLLWRLVRLVKGERGWLLLQVAVEMVLLASLRIQNLLVYGLILLLFWLVRQRRSGRGRESMRVIALGGLVLLVVGAGSLTGTVLRYLTVEQQWRAAGGSAYLAGQVYSSWLDVLLWAPVRFLHFTFGPFPWSVNNIFMALGAVESCLLFGLALFALLGVREKGIRDAVLLLLLFAAVGLFANAIVDSNYGTAIRHKMNYIVIVFTFAAYSLRNLRLKW